MTRTSVVHLVIWSHVALFTLLRLALPGVSFVDAVPLAVFATLLVFDGVANLIFLRAFRKTLVPGYPMSFILGSKPADPNELWAWYWGRAASVAICIGLVAGFTMWGWTNLFECSR